MKRLNQRGRGAEGLLNEAFLQNWVSQRGNKWKCNYYHCLSHTPIGQAGGEGACRCLCAHSHTVMRMSINLRIQTKITSVDVFTESMNNGVTETNRRVAPQHKRTERNCVLVGDKVSGLRLSFTRDTELVLSPSAPPLRSPFTLTDKNTQSHNSCFWKMYKYLCVSE